MSNISCTCTADHAIPCSVTMKVTTMKLFKKILVMVAIAAAAALADDSEISSRKGLDDNELPTNTADFETVSNDLKVFEKLESLAERKSRCSPTISCTRAGGHCVKSKGKCNGVLDASGCKGHKKCKCCIPDLSTPVPTTCPDVTCPTTTTVTSPAITPCPTTTPMTCPNVTCPTATTVTCPTVTCPATTPCPTRATTTIPTTTEPPTTTPIPPTTPIPTTTAPVPTVCTEGLFKIHSSHQCFKMLKDVKVNFMQAQDKCRNQGLIMATNTDHIAIQLRKYILDTYGDFSYVWLNARGDTSGNYIWQQNKAVLRHDSPLWRNGDPESNEFTFANCLYLRAWQSAWNGEPERPYGAFGCSNTRYTLCEATTTIPTTTEPPTTTPIVTTTPIPTTTAPATTTIPTTIEPPTTTPIPPTTPIPTTTAPGECPTGFFKTSGSNSCYKLFKDIKRRWSAAEQKCRDEGLLMAKTDNNAVEVRQYLVETLGLTDFTWLGAKADGSYMRWQRDNVIIPSTSSYWYRYSATSSNCLFLLTKASYLNSAPRVFFSNRDGWDMWTLCEMV